MVGSIAVRLVEIYIFALPLLVLWCVVLTIRGAVRLWRNRLPRRYTVTIHEHREER